MSATVLYMSMSIDGLVTGPNVRPDNGLGDGGLRLHDWAFPEGEFDLTGATLTGANRTVWDEMMATGAVIAGRRTFEPAGGWDGDHHDGVPIFIVARDKPGIDISSWPHSSCSRPAGSTSSSSMSCRCCWAREPSCSVTSCPRRSSSSARASSKEKASPICISGSSASTEVVRAPRRRRLAAGPTLPSASGGG